MAKAEALLKVIGSRPENLADNFATLLPNASPTLYQRILDLKVSFRAAKPSSSSTRPSPAESA